MARIKRGRQPAENKKPMRLLAASGPRAAWRPDPASPKPIATTPASAAKREGGKARSARVVRERQGSPAVARVLLEPAERCGGGEERKERALVSGWRQSTPSGRARLELTPNCAPQTGPISRRPIHPSARGRPNKPVVRMPLIRSRSRSAKPGSVDNFARPEILSQTSTVRRHRRVTAREKAAGLATNKILRALRSNHKPSTKIARSDGPSCVAPPCGGRPSRRGSDPRKPGNQPCCRAIGRAVAYEVKTKNNVATAAASIRRLARAPATNAPAMNGSATIPHAPCSRGITKRLVQLAELSGAGRISPESEESDDGASVIGCSGLVTLIFSRCLWAPAPNRL